MFGLPLAPFDPLRVPMVHSERWSEYATSGIYFQGEFFRYSSLENRFFRVLTPLQPADLTLNNRENLGFQPEKPTLFYIVKSMCYMF